MSGKRARILAVALTSIVTVCWLAGTAAADTRTISSGGTTSIHPAPYGIDVLQDPELRGGPGADEGAGIPNRPRPGFKNGKFPKKPLDAPTVPSSSVAGSNPELERRFLGLNHRDQRLANGGNQFSLEPPDQGLCVGNGVRGRGDEQRPARLQHGDRRAADRRAGPEHVLRLSGADQPDDRCRTGPT